MPFSEATPISINVTLADIAASSQGGTTNSLVTAMKRLNEARQLPGQNPDESLMGNAFYAETSLRLNNGQFVAILDVFCATRLYTADLNTVVIVTLENLTGIKPTAAYTATLAHG